MGWKYVQRDTETGQYRTTDQSGGAGHNYSTTEQVVGTWINGKPLYEKTFDLGSGGMAVSSSFTDSVIPSGNIETIVSVVNACDLNSGGTIFWGGIAAYLPTNANYVKLATDRNSGTSTIRYITLQYTKTTD